MAAIPPGVFEAAGRRVRLAAILVLVICVFGVFACDFLLQLGIAEALPSSQNIFYRLYARHEPAFLWVLLAFALAVWLLAGRSGPKVPWPKPASKSLAMPALLGSAGTLAVTLAGTLAVMHSMPLSMDEYAAAFQATILAAGRVTAPIPVEWQPFAPALVPHFIAYRPAEQVWLSTYLPAYAAIRALFSTVGVEVLVNPLLAATSILSLAGASGRLWPGDVRRGRLAILYLATSAQFLLMSMTGYSWPAHLCFNLLWLYLALRDDRLGLAAAPWAGVVALGLHNPFPHALFVAPFLLRLLRTRRYKWIAYYGAVYSAGSLAWYKWMSYSHGQVGNASPLEVFGLPGAQGYFVQGMNLSLLLTWQAPAMALFLITALWLVRSLKPAERDLMAGLVLTFAFYFLFLHTQGHGWGYRYLYPVLGNAVLLAASATVTIGSQLGGALVARLVAVSTALALMVQLPLRARQAERVVRPYAATLRHIETRPAEVVLVHPGWAYYGRDLIRNDPLSRTRPVVLSVALLTPENVRELVRRYPKRVHLLTVAEMNRLGLTTFEPTPTGVRR
jgi:hypothetical protein